MPCSVLGSVRCGCAPLWCGTLLAVAQAPQADPARLEPAPQAIVEAYRADVFQLADEAMGGRGVGSEGGERAVRFVERRMQSLGLRPLQGEIGRAHV